MLGDSNGYSAMAKCVGVTCGISVQLLDGHSAVKVPGVICPYTKEICEAIREKVEKEGSDEGLEVLRTIDCPISSRVGSFTRAWRGSRI